MARIAARDGAAGEQQRGDALLPLAYLQRGNTDDSGTTAAQGTRRSAPAGVLPAGAVVTKGQVV